MVYYNSPFDIWVVFHPLINNQRVLHYSGGFNDSGQMQLLMHRSHLLRPGEAVPFQETNRNLTTWGLNEQNMEQKVTPNPGNLLILPS